MILCLGTTPALQKSITFDRLVIDAVNRTADVQQYASGKSINVARVLKTLGTPVIATGFAGGNNGEVLRADMDRADINHDFVAVKDETRACITVVDRANQTATELIEESRAVPIESYSALLTKFEKLLPASLGVVLSGSLPPGAPPNFYADCTSAAIAAGKFVLLDATGEPLRRALACRPTIIKPNRLELSQTVGAKIETNEDLKAAIRRLLSVGPQWAVITNGAKETIASDGNQFWKIATPRVSIISPIGSGDSFAGGLAGALAAGQPVPQACQLAAACGSANAMTGLAAHLEKSNVEQLLVQAALSQF